MKISKHLLLPALALSATSSALTFDITWTGTAASDPVVQNAFLAATSRWSNTLTDNVTVKLSLGTSNLGGSVIAQAGSSFIPVSYNSFKTALANKQTTSADAAAVASLQAGSSFSVVSNFWGGTGSATSTFSGLNQVAVNLANARALGLWPSVDGNTDAVITFNSTFNFDFDPSNGITSGQTDFVGVAVHEIGHALGFVSGVDDLSSGSATASAWVNPLDMFRFRSGVNVPYLARNNDNKYFSLDLGATGGTNLFSNGIGTADNRQASHWRDNLGLGIMDPTAAAGELLAISAQDVRAFDVIGWTPVPEPATMVALGLGIAGLARRRRKSA